MQPQKQILRVAQNDNDYDAGIGARMNKIHCDLFADAPCVEAEKPTPVFARRAQQLLDIRFRTTALTIELSALARAKIGRCRGDGGGIHVESEFDTSPTKFCQG